MIYITFGRLIDRNAHSHTSATMCPCYVDRLLLVVYMLQPFRWLLTCIALLLFSLILHQLKSFSKKKKKRKSIIYCSYFTNLNIKEFLHLKLYITKVLRLIKLHINFFFPYSCQMGREERALYKNYQMGKIFIKELYKYLNTFFHFLCLIHPLYILKMHGHYLCYLFSLNIFFIEIICLSLCMPCSIGIYKSALSF